MKLDRLLGILTILLKNDRVTAPQLAESLRLHAALSGGTLIRFVRQEYPL